MEQTADLNKRVSKLEKRVKVLETYINRGYDTYDTVESESIQEKTAHSGPTPLDNFIEWCKTDWLMKLGAFLLLLALGWFVTYAFVNNWIGPTGRIALGILAGAGIMITGNSVVPKKRAAGQILVVLGGVMVLLTVFAARLVYGFFTPITALLIMSVVVVGMAAIAVVHNAKSVAILALLGGGIVPVLVDAPRTDFLSLLSYIFVLNLGTISVAALRGWRSMISLALIITGFYSIFAFPMLKWSAGINWVWIFMALYFGLFFISNIAAIIKTRAACAADLFTTAVNGLLLLYWIYQFVPRESASLVLSGLVLLLVGVSYVLVQLGSLKSMLYIHAGLAVLFLGAATAFELKGETLTIAFAIESLVIVALSVYALKDPRMAQVISITQSIPIIMALPSIVDGSWFVSTLFNKDFFVLLVTILSLTGTAAMLKSQETVKQKMPLVAFYGAAAGLFAIALIWLSSHNIFDSINTARGAALVIYSIIGVILFFYGTYLHNKPQRVTGAMLLAGVVIRLLFVEIWSMSLASKIITFVVIGILLVSTAFFQKRIGNSN